MRFSQATVLAFAALSLAAPAFEADNKNIKREDCDKTSFMVTTNIRELLLTTTLMLPLLLMGTVILSLLSVQFFLLKQLLNPKKLHLLQLQFLQLPPSFKMIH